MLIKVRDGRLLGDASSLPCLVSAGPSVGARNRLCEDEEVVCERSNGVAHKARVGPRASSLTAPGRDARGDHARNAAYVTRSNFVAHEVHTAHVTSAVVVVSSMYMKMMQVGKSAR